MCACSRRNLGAYHFRPTPMVHCADDHRGSVRAAPRDKVAIGLQRDLAQGTRVQQKAASVGVMPRSEVATSPQVRRHRVSLPASRGHELEPNQEPTTPDFARPTVTRSDFPNALTCESRTQRDSPSRNLSAWRAEGRPAKKRSAQGRITPTLRLPCDLADASEERTDLPVTDAFLPPT